MSAAVASGMRSAATPRLSRKLSLGAAAGLIVLVAVVIYAVHYWTVGQYIQTTDDAYVGGDVTDLAPEVSGLIARITVTDNQVVHVGDLLVQIDDRDFREAVQKAQAGVAGEQAALANLDATRDLQDALIKEAQADVSAAAAQIILTRENQSRYAVLAAAHAGTEQDLQTAAMALAQAVAGGAKTAAALAAAQAELTVIDTQKEQANAALASAQADLAVAQLNLQYTQIRAPIDGVIGNRSAHTGGYAEIGAQLLSIVPYDGLWVDANFKENQLARMRPGDRVTISADVLPDDKITGQVGSLSPASGEVFSILPAENATGNFTKIVQRVSVRIWLDGNAGQLGLLRPGLSVNVAVDTNY